MALVKITGLSLSELARITHYELSRPVISKFYNGHKDQVDESKVCRILEKYLVEIWKHRTLTFFDLKSFSEGTVNWEDLA